MDNSGLVYDTFSSVDCAIDIMLSVYRKEFPGVQFTVQQLFTLSNEAIDILTRAEKAKLITLNASAPPLESPESIGRMKNLHKTRYENNIAGLWGPAGKSQP
jgi:hypothetical protein